MTRFLRLSQFILAVGACFLCFSTTSLGQENKRNPAHASSIPAAVMIRIVKAEDERRWDSELSNLLSDANAKVRRRAALAAGRIGNEQSIPALVSLLQNDKDDEVRAMAAFALGETESPLAGDALVVEITRPNKPAIAARIVEALGKTTAALPQPEERRSIAAKQAILETLKSASGKDDELVLLSLTAALRARPDGAGKVVAEFLSSSNSRVRADAANTLARLRAKDGNEQLRKLLESDSDPVVRANAARVLGATTDKQSFEFLAKAAKEDADARVRVSAIRALTALKDEEPRVADALESLWCQRYLLKSGPFLYHERDAVCLELVTALGRVFQGTGNEKVLSRVEHWQWDFRDPAEVQIALSHISPATYLSSVRQGRRLHGLVYEDWRLAASVAQGLGEIAALPETTKDKKTLVAQAEEMVRAMMKYPSLQGQRSKQDMVEASRAVPDMLRAFAAFKTDDLATILRDKLLESDVVIRSTAADLLGEQPPDEMNARALIAALPKALAETDSNDATLSILDALGKQKTAQANDAIKTALDSPDHLVRRRAVGLLKTNGVGDFSSRIGNVRSRNTARDYQRAIGRIGKRVTATVNTSKGAFTIELLPDDSPLTVDNFVQLAKRGYFKNIMFHRVVPNFVIQGGDPRSDGNGGPGYSIRCEINEVAYDRGAVGMALSGKDTGGSQWFVTHSPQPHLDGGYTVFGRVVSGMEVVDQIVRGDGIRSIVITERGRNN